MRVPDATERGAALGHARATGDLVEDVAERILVYTDDGDAFMAKILDEGHKPASVLVRRSTLEDVFLILTGRSLDDG
jgi:lipooligosaccharide transport system ATP-binding protein